MPICRVIFQVQSYLYEITLLTKVDFLSPISFILQLFVGGFHSSLLSGSQSHFLSQMQQPFHSLQSLFTHTL